MEDVLLSRETSQWLGILISIQACRDRLNTTHPLAFFGLRNFCNIITPKEIIISSFNTDYIFSGFFKYGFISLVWNLYTSILFQEENREEYINDQNEPTRSANIHKLLQITDTTKYGIQ